MNPYKKQVHKGSKTSYNRKNLHHNFRWEKFTMVPVKNLKQINRWSDEE